MAGMNWNVDGTNKAQEEVDKLSADLAANHKAITEGPLTVLKLEDSRQVIAAKFSKAVDDLVKQAGAIKVENQETATKATELGAVARKLIKGIDAKVDELTAESLAYTKSVKGYGNSFTSRLKMVYDAVVKKLTEYNSYLELERRKQEEAARKATVVFQETLNAEAEKAGVVAPTVEPQIMPEQKTQIKTDEGATAFTGGRWKAIVTDESKVPREYCSPDSKKINAAVRAGIREIPGIEIKKDEKVRIRT